jgi:hypothetical protein
MIKIDIDVDSFRMLSGSLTPRRFSIAINRAMRTLARETVRELESHTNWWQESPVFEIEYHLHPSQNSEEFYVGTHNRVFHYIDEGVPPHYIYPKNRKALRFLNTYNTGEANSEFIFAKEVLHPGIEAVGISDKVFDKIYGTIDETITTEIGNAWGRQDPGYDWMSQ